MLLVRKRALPEQELESWETTRTTAQPLTPESGLVLVAIKTIPTHVEMMVHGEIMEPRGPKPWDTFWFSRVELSRFVYNRPKETAEFQADWYITLQQSY